MRIRTFIYSIAMFFTSIIIYGQDFKLLEKSDTIFIKFKGNKYEKMYSIQTRIEPTNFDERAYNFVVQDKFGLYFEHPKYKNWEKKEANIVSEVRKVNKSFLKRNKKRIIGIDFFKKNTQNDIVCELFKQFKVLYIIDFTEKNKGNIMLYEVNCTNYCPSIE